MYPKNNKNNIRGAEEGRKRKRERGRMKHNRK